MKKYLLAIMIFAFIGILDAGYLTYEHYNPAVIACSTYSFFSVPVDCGEVLQSSYATVGSIPLALLGVVFYLTVLVVSSGMYLYPEKLKQIEIIRANYHLLPILVLVFGLSGIITSSYLIYLQMSILVAICIYCMISAFTTLGIFTASMFVYRNKNEWVNSAG